MSDLFYEDSAQKPGLHALVVGVSAYPNLPADVDPKRPKTLGLTKIDSAALGAYRIANWLKLHRDELVPRLASIRLLLTPSDAEKQREPALAALTVAHPAIGELMRAADQWRAASDGHADNTTLFYFAGHGVQRQEDRDHVLLLHDFGRDGPGIILESAITATELIDGMRLSERRLKANPARRQLYFFDACKMTSSVFEEYENSPTGHIWEKEKADSDDRQCAVFYSTMPGHLAYGWKDGHSLFCEALLRCLNGAAAEPSHLQTNDPLPWGISIYSLSTGLTATLEKVTQEAVTEQKIMHICSGGDFDILALEAPPKVEVQVLIEPNCAAACARLLVKNMITETEVAVAPPPPVQNPHAIFVPAGTYIFHATHNDDPRRFNDPAPRPLTAHPLRPPVIPVKFTAVLPAVVKPVAAPGDP